MSPGCIKVGIFGFLLAVSCGRENEPSQAREGNLFLDRFGLSTTTTIPSFVTDTVAPDTVLIHAAGTKIRVTKGATLSESLRQELQRIRRYAPRQVAGEELADGWILRFENDGPLGVNHWVIARREFYGTQYRCGTVASSRSGQAHAWDMCLGLALVPRYTL